MCLIWITLIYFSIAGQIWRFCDSPAAHSASEGSVCGGDRRDGGEERKERDEEELWTSVQRRRDEQRRQERAGRRKPGDG